MTEKEGLGFTFACLIEAPVETVFTAVTDRHAISTYFTDASSGPLTLAPPSSGASATSRSTSRSKKSSKTSASSATGLPPEKSTTAPRSPSPSNRAATAPSSRSGKPLVPRHPRPGQRLRPMLRLDPLLRQPQSPPRTQRRPQTLLPLRRQGPPGPSRQLTRRKCGPGCASGGPGCAQPGIRPPCRHSMRPHPRQQPGSCRDLS